MTTVVECEFKVEPHPSGDEDWVQLTCNRCGHVKRWQLGRKLPKRDCGKTKFYVGTAIKKVTNKMGIRQLGGS